MARRVRTRSTTLEVRITFEPSRVGPAWVAQADARVVPITRRPALRAGSPHQAESAPPMQHGGGRQHACTQHTWRSTRACRRSNKRRPRPLRVRWPPCGSGWPPMGWPYPRRCHFLPKGRAGSPWGARRWSVCARWLHRAVWTGSLCTRRIAWPAHMPLKCCWSMRSDALASRAGSSPPDEWGSLSSAAPGGRGDPHGEDRVGSACGVGHLEASSLSRDRGLWHDAAGAAAAPAARPAPPARATAPRRVHERCPAGGLAHHPGPGARRARGMRSAPGTMAGEEAPCAPSAPGGPVSAARLAPMPALWVCLLWETPQPEGPQRPTARRRLLPLSGHRRVALWRRTGLSEDAGTDRSGGPGGLAGRGDLAGAPRAAR